MSSFSKPCLLGIDEAGRGPVLGPMVYGCAYCPIELQKILKDNGFADSKTLTAEEREAMFKIIKKHQHIGWEVRSISAHEISVQMLRRRKVNLNTISHNAAIELVRNTLEKGVNLTHIYVDTVGHPGKYQEKLEREFPGLNVTVAKKADSLYPIVSAASICAKVTRDHQLEDYVFCEDRWHREHVWNQRHVKRVRASKGAGTKGTAPTNGEAKTKQTSSDSDSDSDSDQSSSESAENTGKKTRARKRPRSALTAPPPGVKLRLAKAPTGKKRALCARAFGSGYPGDPNTKAWLREHVHPVFGFPGCVRFGWSTAQKLMAATPGFVEGTWGDTDDDEEEGQVSEVSSGKQSGITSFFAAVGPGAGSGGGSSKQRGKKGSMSSSALSRGATPLMRRKAYFKKNRMVQLDARYFRKLAEAAE